MKWVHGMRNNKGSVTILAIGIMAFLGIILSGVLPMITQEVRIGTMNRDVVEAQYAAESGLKRAIAGLEAGSTSWAWIGQTRQFTGEAGKNYTVSVQNTSPNTLTEGTAPASGLYYLQAVGRVGNANKTVSVKVNLTSGGSSGGLSGVFVNGVFGASGIKMDSNAKVTGSIGTNGKLTMDNGSTVDGDITAYNSLAINKWNSVTITGATPESKTATVAVPTFSTTYTLPSSTGAAAWTWDTGWKKTVNVPTGKYKYTGTLSVGASTVTVADNTTLFFNGLNIQNDSTVTLGNNAVLCVNGNLSLESSNSKLVTQGKATIYVTGNFTIANGARLLLGGDTTVYVGGQLYLSKGYIITTKNTNVVLKVGTLKLDGSSYIQAPDRTVGDTTSLAILVGSSNADTAAYLTNYSHLDNVLLLSNGGIKLDSSSAIDGAAISTTGNVYMTNNTVVTYDAASVSAALTNNPGMVTGGGGAGGGANTVITSEWKNL